MSLHLYRGLRIQPVSLSTTRLAAGLGLPLLSSTFNAPLRWCVTSSLCIRVEDRVSLTVVDGGGVLSGLPPALGNILVCQALPFPAPPLLSHCVTLFTHHFGLNKNSVSGSRLQSLVHATPHRTRICIPYRCGGGHIYAVTFELKIKIANKNTLNSRALEFIPTGLQSRIH